MPVVKAAAPWAVEYDDHTAAYLSGRPHTAGDLPADPEGMKQGGGIHQGAEDRQRRAGACRITSE
ncbi:MAG: hypothetical protein ACLSAF_17485 [Intestinimonas sp.]